MKIEDMMKFIAAGIVLFLCGTVMTFLAGVILLIKVLFR